MEALTVPESPTPRTVPVLIIYHWHLSRIDVLRERRTVPARVPHPAATAGVAAPADTTIRATPE